MGLSIADIDKWNPDSISAVGAASTARANAASQASTGLGSLSAFDSWQGAGANAAQARTQVHADSLTQHGQAVSAVATAANTAANEVRQVKTQLSELRTTLGQYGMSVDASGSRVVPPTNLSSLPAATRKLVQDLTTTAQQSLDKLRQAADHADDLLSDALKKKIDDKLSEKKTVKEGEKKFGTDFDNPGKKEKDKDGKEVDPKGKSISKKGEKEFDLPGKKDDANTKPASTDGKKEDDKSSNKPEVKVKDLGKAEVSATAYEKDVKGEKTFENGAEVSGEAGVKVASAEASANAEITSNGISAGANASANLASAEAKGHAEYGIVSGDASANAAVGANASATGSIGKDGLNAHLEAFAGASAGADANVNVGGVGAGAHAEVQAGIGASADVNAGIKDGKLKIGGELGACLGVGGKVSFNVEIDPKEVTKTVTDGAKKVGNFLGGLFD